MGDCPGGNLHTSLLIARIECARKCDERIELVVIDDDE